MKLSSDVTPENRSAGSRIPHAIVSRSQTRIEIGTEKEGRDSESLLGQPPDDATVLLEQPERV
jgi:hypothetical protein